MREIIARTVSVFTVLLIVALSWQFAAKHNKSAMSARRSIAVVAAPAAASEHTEMKPIETQSDTVAPPPSSTADEIERGRAVYAEQKCATCHSLGGEGNPRYPLDGVGSRWAADELREWITGTGVAKEVLSAGIAKRKQRYQSISPEDMSGLVAFLSAATSN